MIVAPIPSHESARLDALHRLQLLNTGSEPAFDELAQLAAYVCRAPIAVISLVDASRQWFKAVVGLPYTESPRSIAFCAHTILGTTPFIVEEADADERFHDHPWVIEPPAVRFYAGVPLLTREGHAIGSLAVMDIVPRSLTPEQRAAMQTLARQVMAQCELRERRSAWNRDEPNLALAQTSAGRPADVSADDRARKEEGDARRWQQVFDHAGFGLAYGDILTNTFVTVNRTFARQCGYTVEELIGQPILSIYAPQEHAAMKERILLIEREGHLTFESVHQRKDGTTFPVMVEVTVINDSEGRPLSRVAYVKDITERTRAEDALQLAKYSLDHATEAIYWVGAGAELLDVNDAACAMLGYSKDEFRRMTVHDINPFFQPDSWPAFWEQSRQQGRASFESYHRAKDGRLIPIEVNVNFLTCHGRESHCAFVRDISERKRAEGALRKSEERFQFAIEATNDGLWDWDIPTGVIHFSPQWIRLLGYLPEEVTPSTAFLFAILHPEDEPRMAEVLQAHLDGWTPLKELEVRLRQKSGEYRWYLDRGKVVVRDPEGYPLRMVGTITDITERKQAEQERAEALGNLQTIMETVPDVIFALDLEGRLSKWNRRMEAVTGYTCDELQGKPALDMVPSEEAEKTAAAIRKAFEAGYAELEGHLLAKDGRTILYHWTGTPYTDMQGRVIGITGVGRDITERKKAEQLLAAETCILELIGSDAALPLVLVEICLMIEGLSKGVRCSILLLDEDGVHLRHGAAPSLPESYTRAIDGVAIGPSRGSCGTAAFTGRQVIVEDIASDASWADFRDLALLHGLRACWSTPILASTGKVLGTFAVYAETPRQPIDELPLVDRASYLACLAIERKRTEQALRLTRFSIQQAVDAIFWVDADARILDVNDAACTTLGYTRDELVSRTVHDIDANFPPEAWPVHWEELKARTSFSFEGTHQKKDGTVIQTETTVNFLIHDGREYNCAFMRDITDRKRAEAQLHLTQFAIEQAGDMMFWTDPSARFLLVNAAACERLAYSKEELLGMTVLDIDLNYQRETWAGHWKELRQTGRLRFETQHRSKSGEVYPVEVVANFVLFHGREYKFATVRDISDRKQAEEALRMTRFSVERVSDAVFWVDAQARILDANEAACRSLQYTRGELLSMSLFEIDPHVTPENWSALWKDKLEQRSLTFESSQIRKDGTIYPVEITCNHLRFGDQEFCCAIQRDISERQRAETLLRLSEERFRLVAEATNDILWDWDLATQNHWWSPNAREKFGYDPNLEPSVTAWTDRLHPDDRDRVLEVLNRARTSDARTVSAEYRFRLADGSYGYFYNRGQIIRDSSGQACRIIGAMIDVTFSKRAYASLETAYQRLQSMSRELQAVETNERRRLSRELHDEVGQLLTALKFDLEASRQALSDKTAVEAGRAFERTVRAMETTDELFVRLRRVVRALRPSVLEELGLTDALEAMVSDIQSRSDLVCSVSVEGEAVEDPATPAIEAALYRMAQELVTNVVRHAQAMTLSVALDMDPGQWLLTVQDDGVGFNPNAESISGTGIRGVRERAEILGGHVDISSLPGAGTTITVWIPVRARTLFGDGSDGM